MGSISIVRLLISWLRSEAAVLRTGALAITSTIELTALA